MNGNYQQVSRTTGTVWCGRFSYDDPATGRRVHKRVYAPTKAACQTKVRHELGRLDRGLVSKDDALTVAAYLEQWLAAHGPTVRATTYRRYAGIVRNHLAPALKSTKLTKLTTLELQALYYALGHQGASPSQLAYVHTVIRTALGQAVAQGAPPRPPRAD